VVVGRGSVERSRIPPFFVVVNQASLLVIRSIASPLIYADGENNFFRVVERKSGATLSTFGRSGRNTGQFHWVHQIAVDSKRNIYTGEVDTGKRIQKFVAMGAR
jgi:hypothetical protein